MNKIPTLLIVFLLCCLSLPAQAKVEVITEKANLRGTPTPSGTAVTQVSQWQIFDLIKQVGPWFLVQTPEYAGWPHGNTIRIVGGPTSPAKSIALQPSKPRPR